jgi:hypothetical protein
MLTHPLAVSIRHPSAQNHKGMELRNSVGPHTIDSQAPKEFLVPILPRDSPLPTKAAKEGVDGPVHLIPSCFTVPHGL